MLMCLCAYVLMCLCAYVLMSKKYTLMCLCLKYVFMSENKGLCYKNYCDSGIFE